MSQRKIFTSTSRKRTSVRDTGQTTANAKKKAKNLPDINTDASQVYRVVLRASQESGSSSGKKKKKGSTRKKTSKQKQKETEVLNSQNLNKDNSPSGVSPNVKEKTGDGPADQNQKENGEPKVRNEKPLGKRAKYKLQVNREIQKLFSKRFCNDKKKNPNHLQNSNQNEADNMIDIWSLSEGIGPTQPDSTVRTQQSAPKSQKVSSPRSVHSTQLYEFPDSPGTGGKERLKAKARKKRSKKKKKDPKKALAVDQILKVLHQTKMEMELIREKMFKKKTKHK